MPPSTDNPSIMIIAGEVSGDQRGAELVRAIRTKRPDYTFFGIGGERMREANVDTLYDVGDMAVMGLSEVLARLAFFQRVFNSMLHEAKTRRPLAVILIDYPGFNLRLAARVHALGIKVIYYICPQVWAWNRGRIPRMAKNIDRLISIFPFEAQHFKGTGLSVDYVGHPLVDEARAVHSDADFGSLPWKGEPRIALLPGSRRQEVQRILPVMLDAVDGFGESHPDASFIVAAPSPEIEACINDTIKGHRASSIVKVSVATGSTRAVLKQAHAAVVTSGTATLEASLMRCPMIVVYRMAPLTYCFGKILVRVDHIGMVNLVAGSRLCPELIQGEANGRRIAAELEPIVSDPETRERMLAGLDEVNAGLGDGGAATRAADSVISALQV